MGTVVVVVKVVLNVCGHIVTVIPIFAVIVRMGMVVHGFENRWSPCLTIHDVL